jgi:Predicted glycosyltransferases
MIEKIILSGSIVLYNENLKELKNTIDCFLSAKFTKKLFLIDNTPDSRFKGTFTHTDIVYFEVGKNIGFGRGHNLVLDKIKNHSTYHLVLNPDVSFKASILNKLIEQLQTDASLAMVAPKVLFPDNAPQYSCRRYPSVLELIIRRVFFLRPMFRTLLNKGTYKDKNLNFPFYCRISNRLFSVL